MLLAVWHDFARKLLKMLINCRARKILDQISVAIKQQHGTVWIKELLRKFVD